jgi:hypothetical protein
MKRIFAVGLLVALSSYVLAAEPMKTVASAQKVLSSENGRFVLGQLSDVRADRFLLDTQTGRVWQLVNYTPMDKDGKPVGSPRQVLQSTMFIDSNDKMSAFPIQDTEDSVKGILGTTNKVK